MRTLEHPHLCDMHDSSPTIYAIIRSCESMETYGLQLESFLKTDAGTVYADIRDKILPYLRKQEADCLDSPDLQRRTLKELDGFRARLEFVRTELADLSQRAGSEICGRPFRSAVAFRPVPEESDSEVDAACKAFADWSGNSFAATDKLLHAVHDACAVKTEGIKCMKEFSAVFRMAIEFWAAAADVYVCDYIFANAEMKYKMKICRDIIKAMPVIIRSGEAFLNRCDARKFLPPVTSVNRVLQLNRRCHNAASSAPVAILPHHRNRLPLASAPHTTPLLFSRWFLFRACVILARNQSCRMGRTFSKLVLI